jgi:hypothetical protein
VPDVARASMRLLKNFGIQFRPSLSGGGARDASVGDQALRLRRQHGEQPPSVVLRAGTKGVLAELLGVRWEIVPSRLTA